MARKKKSSNRAASDRATRIRAKIRGGDEASIEELEWLRAYELAPKGKPGRPKKVATDDRDETQAGAADPAETPDPGDEGDEGDELAELGELGDRPAADPAPEASAAASVDPAPAPGPPPPRPPRVKLSAPPRTRTAPPGDEPKAGSKSDWRGKYADGFGGAGGRETTVTEIAKVWRGVLESLCDGMRSAGIEPKVDPAMLYPSIVLVVDELLPPHVELTPKMVAVGGTSVLLVQRFVNRKEIADVEKRKRDADAMRARTEERKQRAADPDPAPAADAPATPAPSDPVAAPPPGDASGFAERVNGSAIHRMSSAELLAADPTAVI